MGFKKVFSWGYLKNFFLNKTTILLLLNHLIVLYAFFLPLNTDIRKSIFFMIVAIWILFYRNFKETLFFALQNRVIQSFSAIFIMYALWLIGSDNTEQAIWFLKGAKIYLYSIVLFALTQYAFLKRIFTAFFLGMFINELMSYGIFFEILPSSLSYYGTPLDPTPYEYTHLAYGFMLSLICGIVLYNFFKNEELSQSNKWFLGIFFFSATANIFITGGRIGYILYAVSIITVVLYLFRHVWKRAFVISILSILIVYMSAYYFSPIVYERVNLGISDIEQILQKGNFTASFGTRVAIWITAVDVIKEHWFLGVGLGDHMDVLRTSAEINHPEFLHLIDYVGTNIHNSYFEIIMQFGIIGLLVFGNLFYQIIIYNQPDRQLKLMQYLVIAVTLVYGLVNIWARNIPGVVFVSILAFSLIKPTLQGITLPIINRNQVIGYVATALVIALIAPLT